MISFRILPIHISLSDKTPRLGLASKLLLAIFQPDQLVMYASVVEAAWQLGRRLPAPVRAAMRQAYTQWENRHAAIAESNDVVDVVICHVEISASHGTGIVLSRLFEGRSDLVTILSRTYYGGKQSICPRATFVLPFRMTNRNAIFERVSKWLRKYRVRSILCVPYFETDLTLAIAAQAVSGAPLGIWIMDDNCLEKEGIRRESMAEAIERATALFAISPQLKQRYQQQFRKSLTVVPPLVPTSMVRSSPSPIPTTRRLLVIGNVWSDAMLERMSRAIEAAGLSVDWLLPNPKGEPRSLTPSALAGRGVQIKDGSDPDSVRESVTQATAVIIPGDPGDAGTHERALGEMSLPSRMPFILATAGTPMIVLARPGTVAGTFVEHFGVGRVVPYDGDALRAAVEELDRPEIQRTIRTRSAEVAEKFSFSGLGDFILDAILERGRRKENRFDAVLPEELSAPPASSTTDAPKADYDDLVASLCKGTTAGLRGEKSIPPPDPVWSRIDKIEGFFTRTNYLVWEAFLEFQKSSGISGNLFEIGTWHGRSAAALANRRGPKESLILCDLLLDRLRVRDNLAANGFDTSRIVTSCKKSSALGRSELEEYEKTIRWFHIDGDHSAEAVFSDLAIADRFLAEQGVIVLDDFFSPRYVSITLAAFSYLRSNPHSLKLLLVGDNKGYLCKPSCFNFYRSFLLRSLPAALRRCNEPLALHQSTGLFDTETLGLGHGFMHDRTFIGFDKSHDTFECVNEARTPY
jgi:hypothetical protein